MVSAGKRVAVVRRDSLQFGLSDSHMRVIEHRPGDSQHPRIGEVGSESRQVGNYAYGVVGVRFDRLLADASTYSRTESISDSGMTPSITHHPSCLSCIRYGSISASHLVGNQRGLILHDQSILPFTLTPQTVTSGGSSVSE